jgi:hypothetical protein
VVEGAVVGLVCAGVWLVTPGEAAFCPAVALSGAVLGAAGAAAALLWSLCGLLESGVLAGGLVDCGFVVCGLLVELLGCAVELDGAADWFISELVLDCGFAVLDAALLLDGAALLDGV